MNGRGRTRPLSGLRLSGPDSMALAYGAKVNREGASRYPYLFFFLFFFFVVVLTV